MRVRRHPTFNWRILVGAGLASVVGCSSADPSSADAGPLSTSQPPGDSGRFPPGSVDAAHAREDASRPPHGGSGSGTSAGSSSKDAGVDTGAPSGNWVLTWSDEFNGANGSPPDPTFWTYTSIGGGTSGPGWGVENDTPSAVAQQDGNLVITSTEDSGGTVSSGAIDTKGKFQQTYGRFEARVKVAEGAGTWSAFWMMGDTNGQGWPTCGEIDVIETVASSPGTAFGTTHTGNMSNATQDTPTGGTWMLPSGNLGDEYHLYAVEWAPDSIKWYVDDNLYETQTNTTLTAGAVWAFDHPFYVIVNLEMGGSWAGPPNASTFPAKMLVDYVRVYKAG